MKRRSIEVNDILFTKDGRKTGNLTVIDVLDTYYVCISDYGNKLTILKSESLTKHFYSKLGKADSTHKYYNYKENHPEEFV